MIGSRNSCLRIPYIKLYSFLSDWETKYEDRLEFPVLMFPEMVNENVLEWRVIQCSNVATICGPMLKPHSAFFKLFLSLAWLGLSREAQEKGDPALETRRDEG